MVFGLLKSRRMKSAQSKGSAEPIKMDGELEPHIHEVGKKLLKLSDDQKQSLLSTAFWSDKLMNWAMQDEAFKVQLFRFVDTFPMLKTPEQVHDHLTDYLSQPGVTLPSGLGIGLKGGGLFKGQMTNLVTGRIKAMAQRFIAGEDAPSAVPYLEKRWLKNVAFSVDLLGEACVSHAEAKVYQDRYLALTKEIPERVASWPANPLLETDHLGPIPRTNLSIKISSLFANTDPIDAEGSITALVEQLGPILKSAKQHNALINFDMEQFELKDLTLDLFMRCCETYDFEAGLAMQAYLRSGDDDAQRIVEWATKSGRQVTVRLVKGAYWDYEVIHAEQMGWPVPVWTTKSDTDACFERMTKIFVDAIPTTLDQGGVKLALGSHNVRSIAAAIAMIEQRGLPHSAIELQMLHGMADRIKDAAIAMDFRLREYVPVGEMIPGMAYLVRRLLENTSNESWLRSEAGSEGDVETLLASPHRDGHDQSPLGRLDQAPERHHLSVATEGVGDGRPFFSEPMRDFGDAKQHAAYANAIEKYAVPKVSIDATVVDAEQAVATCAEAFPVWRDTAPRERSKVLVDAAAQMRDRRDELSAIVLKESGKTWREADADVCEAIDFLEYYAREAVSLFETHRLGAFIGELDQQWHQPRGVAVIISPWNFPLAICTGMTSAALVTGNTVIVKPAEQTPAIAKVMCEILWKAGAPKQALQFVSGPGETVGAALVRDPRVSLIAFTGSKAVGLDIISAAAETPTGQYFVKKVVCEMGGKNSIIIDTSADLDEAVLGVRASAFGFQGQKCSACSRVITVGEVHQQFVERLVESTRTLVVGKPVAPGTDIGPVIDQEAANKIRSYVELGKKEATLALGSEVPANLEAEVGMPYVTPHIFTDVGPEDRLAQEEIFGPVLAVIQAKDFEDALRIANNTQYKLTGGVFSRKPAHLEMARDQFRVGNLYLNRTCTGALVGRQPFGGFGLSGIGSKAGGSDYLLQFVEPRCVSENTMRRGFAPGL